MNGEELAEGLGRWLSGDVRQLNRLTGGASRETWAFDLIGADGTARPLIVQRERPGSGRAGKGGIPAEAVVLPAAAAAGVPVPPLVAADPSGAVLGAPAMVVARVDGETIARRILRDDEYRDARPVLAAQCGRALAGIHSIDPAVDPELDQQDQVAQYRQVLDDLDEPHPAFELGFRWLEANRPAPTRTTVVHGDFRLGNLMVGFDGLRAVLDWELVHLGDPMEDLGWLCVKAWRFGESAPVAGVGAYDELFDAYAEASGTAVDPGVVRWWEALGTLKWGIMCMMQAAAHLHGFSRSVELAAIGRRVCENEHDLLLLLPGGGEPAEPADASTAVTAAPGLHGRPTLAELVEAVREFLEGDVMAVEGRVGFHGRVAARVLATIERELADGGAMERAHAERLGVLGFDDDATLAKAIRSGELDDRYDEIRAAVAASVHDKLLIANPGYL